MSGGSRTVGANVYYGVGLATTGIGVAAGWASHSPVVGVSAGVATIGMLMVFTNLTDTLVRRIDGSTRPPRNASSIPCGPDP